MVADPAVTPVTDPVVRPTVALVLLLVQVPPPPSLKAVADPIQTLPDPVIDEGKGLTVITVFVEQPVSGKV